MANHAIVPQAVCREQFEKPEEGLGWRRRLRESVPRLPERHRGGGCVNAHIFPYLSTH